MAMRYLINTCIAFKDFFVGTMFRRVVSLVMLSTISFLAYSVKVVPNYATKIGSALVWKSDYEKYQQGYCLAENTILSKEEIYKRGISQYLRNSLTVVRMISASLKKMGITNYEYSDKSVPIEYYALDENKITLSNWYEVIDTKYNAKNRKTGYRELFMKDLHATPTDPTRYITIDMKSLTAGFIRPIFLYREEGYIFMFNQSFILNSDGHSFTINWVYLHEDSTNTTLLGQKKSYEYAIERQRNNIYDYKLDNCGNINYDIEDTHKRVLDVTLNGG
jgi:hypothetical protein